MRRHRTPGPLRMLTCSLLLLTLLGCASHARPVGTSAAAPLERADIVVFAPHPDDESIACAGVILTALAKGQRVRVVFLTNGDGYPIASATLRGKPETELTSEDFIELARTRQREALSAAPILGLRPEQLTFLGFPDAGLDKVYESNDTMPYQQAFTLQRETYGPARLDYNSQAHGRPAPYTRASALANVVDILQRTRPGRIYTASGADTHHDHQATFWFVRDAAQAAGYRGVISTFLVHTDPLATYPCPAGFTPHRPFVPCSPFNGQTLVADLPWPPAERITLPPAQAERKLQAVRAHRSQCQLEGEGTYLESFVKSEEVFWPIGPTQPVQETK
jgi:LmbE family N-acetylglucosaminyl deacetylase